MLLIAALAAACVLYNHGERHTLAPPATAPSAEEENIPDVPLPDEPCGVEVSVDWNETHQTIVGFGGTMGWIHPHERNREKIFDLLFNDLGVSVLRIRALGGEGGDEDSAEPENENDDPDDLDLAKFRFKTTEARNATIIKAAQARGVQTIIPTAWSPPAWMKTSGKRAGRGELMPGMLDEYAEVWTAYVLAMKEHFDVDVRDISIQNEPDMEYYYPTCGIPEELYPRAMAAVQARLRREGLSVRVLGPDTCRIYNMPDYLARLDAANVNPGGPVLTHLYDLSIPYERVEKDAPRWEEAREVARKAGRPLWLMETANYLSNCEPASWREALIWAQKVHAALVHGNCEVVCYWSLYFDKPGEALIYAEKSDAGEYEITPKFYTSMHWFRFVRPGMVRVAATSQDNNILASAFRQPGGPGRVLVLINLNDKPTHVRLPVPRGVEAERYETTPDKHCELVAAAAGAVLAPGSVTTIVWDAGEQD